MPYKPNKLSHFWQELKRRNVLRSLTIYAGTAYIIFEATTLIFPRWGFPEWTIDIVLYLLIFGAFINIVIAWIFDLTPKGVEKTKPSSELQEGEKRAVSNSWRIATYASVVLIIGLILLNIFNLRKVSESLTQYGKSIAVLPFINETPDEENEYFINGTRTSIIDNLSKIKDLRVSASSSLDQYRAAMIPIPEIAEKHKVSFFLQGDMQKYGEQIRIMLRLSDQNDRQIWSKKFDRKIEPDQGEKYFTLQSEIAQLVAEELKVVITPEERERIEKPPTSSLTAHIFFQRGMDIYWEYLNEKVKDTTKLNTAEALYYESLESDSTYAPAYFGLASVVYRKYLKFNSNQILGDSVLKLANKALSYDDQLAEAYNLRGLYYTYVTGEKEKGLEEYNIALKFNPNLWTSLYNKAMYYYSTDLPKAIECLHQAIWHNQGLEETDIVLHRLIMMYKSAGFLDKAEYYSEQKLKLNRDSAQYYAYLSWFEFQDGNWDKVIELCNKRLAIDSTDTDALVDMGAAYLLLEEYEKSLKYFEDFIDKMNTTSEMGFNSCQWIGYAYWKNGNPEMADYYFEQALEILNEAIEIWPAPFRIFFRASVFTFQGKKEEAMKDLRRYHDLEGIHYDNLRWMQLYPFFDNLRDDPEFQQILHNMEAKCQAEHERVKQWLEENEML